jgi:hypothetical protein
VACPRGLDLAVIAKGATVAAMHVKGPLKGYGSGAKPDHPA